MVFGIFGMMIAAAFPSTPEQDKIAEDNERKYERSCIRVSERVR